MSFLRFPTTPLGWRTYLRENESMAHWFGAGCPARIHYQAQQIRGRLTIKPCMCLAERGWRRHKMQRRLGMNEN